MLNGLKVALVHDWLNGMRGGEKVLEVLCDIFPSSDLYTIIYDKEKISKNISSHSVTPSFIQKLPGALKHYRYYLPLFPSAIEQFDLSQKKYDLVVSTSHCVAKGIYPPAGAFHLSYCFTPMRYAWSLQKDYLGKGVKRALAAPILAALRSWDKKSSKRVHQFVGISNYVAERIRNYYGREADVIYPPVNTEQFKLNPHKKEHFIVLSALVPYKRIDLAIQAFNQLGYPLKIIGAGNCLNQLKKIAGPNISFMGWQTDEVIQKELGEARALIFPGEEDFGIVPLESLACGTPVIAYGKGGVLETICKGSGIFFPEQTVASLCEGIRQFIAVEKSFIPDFLRKEAEKFNRNRFKNEIEHYIQEKYEQFQMA